MTKAQYIKQAQALGRKVAKMSTFADQAYEIFQTLRDLRTKYRGPGDLTDKERLASTRLGLKSLAQGITRQLR